MMYDEPARLYPKLPSNIPGVKKISISSMQHKLFHILPESWLELLLFYCAGFLIFHQRLGLAKACILQLKA